MTDHRYKVSKLFKMAFGINSPVFIVDEGKKTTPENISFKGLEVMDNKINEYGNSEMSWLGTPIIFPTYFGKGNYKMFKGNGQIELVSMERFRLPPATMFSFRRAKNIVKTNVLGRNGTVKEIFGFDDWIIDVKGLCLDEPNNSAKQQLDTLLKFNNLADSIEISGALFEQLEISEIAIENWAHDYIQGKNGVVSFQFQMCSVDPFILRFE